MSNEDRKQNPMFKFKDIGLDKEVTIKLDCAKPIATGESKFGTWNLWVGFVENQTVYEGRKPNEAVVKDYTGKAGFFPSEKVNEQLLEIANSKVGVTVTVKAVPFENGEGFISKMYEITKTGEGEATEASLTPTEDKILSDIKELTKEGYTLSESDIINLSKDDKYEGKISLERAKEIYIDFVK